MKVKKVFYTMIIAASAFLAYNTLNIVKAETANDNEKTTVTEVQEVSPFDNSVTTKKTTTTTSENTINIEDIQPALIKELKPDITEVMHETITVKEETKEDGTVVQIQEKTIDNVKVEPTGVKATTTEEKKVIETKKELPNLEDIKLPDVSQKPINNDPVKIEVASQRIPVGTVIPVKLESSINSISSTMGDQFNATLTSDIMLGEKIILPAGSVIRGTVGKVYKSNILVKEAKVMLIFDHIVTPIGKQIPIYAYITGDKSVNYEGYITGGTSYAKAFKKDAQKGKDILVNSTTFGVDKGLAYLAGVPVVITAPVCAIGGALGGGGFIVGKSVYNIFTKGADVTLNNGTRLNITLSKPLDIPLN